MKSVYAIFILIIFCDLFHGQSLDSIQPPDSVTDMYVLGYTTGAAIANKSTFIEHSVAGFAAGCGGSCVGFFLATQYGWKFPNDNPYGRIAPTILGGLVTGGSLFYGETRDNFIPFDSSAVDSLFCAGFNDGYIKGSRSKRLGAVAAGCCGGIAIVTAIVLWGIATFSNMEL